MVLGKAIGGVALAGLISVGGVAIAKPELLGMSDPMPDNWHSLAEDHEFDTQKGQTYKDGMGKKYSRYLVGVTNKKNGTNNDNNKYWWEWSFRRLEKDKTSKDSTPGAKFSNAENYSTSGTKAINKICEAAYKANHASEFLTTTDGSSDDSNKYKEDDVWKYCSPLGRKPVSVKDATSPNKETTDTNNIGGEESSTSQLVSTMDTKNDLFWEIRDKEFKAGKSPFDISESDNKYFNARKGKMKIKDICAASYKQNKDNSTSEDNKAVKTETLKFCAFQADS